MPELHAVDTPLLRVVYQDWNPCAERAVVLLHGWPDSPRTWLGIASHLAMLSVGYGTNLPTQPIEIAQARLYW